VTALPDDTSDAGPGSSASPVLPDNAGASTDLVFPDYTGAWTGAVMPALLNGQHPDWLPGPLAGARGVLLLVLDGLGWAMLREQQARMPTLAAMAGGPITTVVPSTTAAGLTSLATGAAPAEHGLTGYRIRVGGEPLNVLQWDKKGPDPATTQPVPPFLGLQVPVVTRAEFRNSGFTLAHLRSGTLIGWKTTATLVEHCRGLASDKHSFVYAYYDGIDKVAHEFGLGRYYDAELEAVDRLVAETGFERPAALAEVKRYTSTPTYQLSYLFGRHMIEKLKADVQAREGDNFELRRFHDTLIYGGTMPVSYARRLFETNGR